MGLHAILCIFAGSIQFYPLFIMQELMEQILLSAGKGLDWEELNEDIIKEGAEGGSGVGVIDPWKYCMWDWWFRIQLQICENLLVIIIGNHSLPINGVFTILIIIFETFE